MKIGNYNISKKQILIVIMVISAVSIFGYLIYTANSTGSDPDPIICKEDEKLSLCNDGTSNCVKKCNAYQDRCPVDDECNSVCLDDTQKCINGVPCDKTNICEKDQDICCDGKGQFCNTNQQCTTCDDPSKSFKCESSNTCCDIGTTCCGTQCCNTDQKCVDADICCGKDQEYTDDHKCCDLNKIYIDVEGKSVCCTGSVCYNKGESKCCTSIDSKCTIKSTCNKETTKCEYTCPEDGTTKSMSIPGGCKKDDDCWGLGYKIGSCYKASMDVTTKKITYNKVDCPDDDANDIIHDGGCSIVCNNTTSDLPSIYCPDGTICSKTENSNGISTRYCLDKTNLPVILTPPYSNPNSIYTGESSAPITTCSQYYEVDSKYKDTDCLLYNTNKELPSSGGSIDPNKETGWLPPTGVKPVHDSNVDKYFCPVDYTQNKQTYFISPLGLKYADQDSGKAPIQITNDNYQGYGWPTNPPYTNKTGTENVIISKNDFKIDFPFGPYKYGVGVSPVLRSQTKLTYDGTKTKPRLIDCLSQVNYNGLTNVDLDETQTDPVCTGTFDCSKYLDTNSNVINKIKDPYSEVIDDKNNWSGLYCGEGSSPKYGILEDTNNNTVSGITWCEKNNYVGI